MAGAFTTLNLSQLPSPDVVETLDFEAILAEMLADLRARDPAFTATVESDPAYKILEVAAYRELVLRQRVNDAARAVMLAFAVGSDLDQIGANSNVQRLVLDPGNPSAVPPVPPTLESDEDFRARIQLSLEGITTAGSEGSYVFHALSADPDVKDIKAVSPTPGVVEVYVLSRQGNGTAMPALLAAVNAALSDDDVRPLTDNVTVLSAGIVNYTIDATLIIRNGPDREVIRSRAVQQLEFLINDQRRIGDRVAVSEIYAALQQPGVDYVTLSQPTTDVITGPTEAPFCTGYIVSMESD